MMLPLREYRSLCSSTFQYIRQCRIAIGIPVLDRRLGSVLRGSVLAVNLEWSEKAGNWF